MPGTGTGTRGSTPFAPRSPGLSSSIYGPEGLGYFYNLSNPGTSPAPTYYYPLQSPAQSFTLQQVPGRVPGQAAAAASIPVPVPVSVPASQAQLAQAHAHAQAQAQAQAAQASQAAQAARAAAIQQAAQAAQAQAQALAQPHQYQNLNQHFNTSNGLITATAPTIASVPVPVPVSIHHQAQKSQNQHQSHNHIRSHSHPHPHPHSRTHSPNSFHLPPQAHHAQYQQKLQQQQQQQPLQSLHQHQQQNQQQNQQQPQQQQPLHFAASFDETTPLSSYFTQSEVHYYSPLQAVYQQLPPQQAYHPLHATSSYTSYSEPPVSTKSPSTSQQPLSQQSKEPLRRQQPQPQSPPTTNRPSILNTTTNTNVMPRGKAAAQVVAQEAEVMDSPVRTKFPTARIKRIMQADDEVGKVAQQTPIAVGKALELFMVQLVQKSADVAKEKGSKRITPLMLKQAIDSNNEWDFLREIVSKVTEEKESSKASGRPKGDSESDDDADGSESKRRRGGRRKRSAA